MQKTRIWAVLKLLAFLMILYSLSRFFFFYFNHDLYQLTQWKDLAFSFLIGLRFDLSAIIFLNIPIILLALLPLFILPSKVFKITSYLYFTIVNSYFYLMNLGDIEYYKYTGRRVTSEVLAFQGEASNQMLQFLINYWDIAMIGAFSVVALFIFTKKTLHVDFKKLGFLPAFSIAFLALVLGVFAARGGLQKKPLKVSHAYTLEKKELGDLSLNSSFTFLHSLKNDSLPKVSYFNKEELYKLLDSTKYSEKKNINNKKQNVVIIILESFATEFWGAANNYKGYTPFLDQLAKKSLFFRNNFANGKRSIEALPSILYGIPSMMERPVAISKYQINHWVALPEILKQNDYHTSFFHGAEKGTMYFDMISARAGFQDYYPLESFPEKEKYFDGNWGIYDEPFLQFMVKKLSTFPKPFFSTVFTISTHQPYHVPQKYKGKFPKGSLKIHESVGYVDHAVKKFFEAASKEDWFNNTLFIITADHTQMSDSEYYNTPLGNFMVPLLFYHPQQNLKELTNQDKITEHTDIPVSILDYLGIPSPNVSLFSDSVFRTKDSSAVTYLSGNYWLIEKDFFLQYNPQNKTKHLYAYEDKNQKDPITDQPKTINRLLKKLRAFIQYHNNSLREDTLYRIHASAKN